MIVRENLRQLEYTYLQEKIMTNSVEIVTITAKSSLFKKGTGEPATNIELINFSFSNGDECGFNVVSQKDLYSIGDSAIYIQPDYCIPKTELFSSFHAPYGDPNKSKLGKNGRIRAIKFNFNLENKSDSIYSNGILLPLLEVDFPVDVNDFSEFLSITKYEEPEKFVASDAKGSLPSFLYKTDEENAANLKSYITKILEAGERIGWTLKVDGSSFTQYFKKNEGEWVTGICSRSLEKKLDDIEDTSDPWIKLSIASELYKRGIDYCQQYDRELAFRGEIYGEGVTKGSGNKINPHSKEKPNLAIFGIDDLTSGYAVRLLSREVEEICKELDLNYLASEEILEVDSYEQLMVRANNLFSYYKETKSQVIEGIVIRTLNNNKLSCKIMNNVYDEKK